MIGEAPSGVDPAGSLSRFTRSILARFKQKGKRTTWKVHVYGWKRDGRRKTKWIGIYPAWGPLQLFSSGCASTHKQNLWLLYLGTATVQCTVYNLSFNRCVARVCCKSARHWLTVPPSNSTQTTDGRSVGQLLCFGCMLAITAHDVIAYITLDDRPNISSALSRLRTARPTQWRNYNLWASRQTFATGLSPPLNPLMPVHIDVLPPPGIAGAADG